MNILFIGSYLPSPSINSYFNYRYIKKLIKEGNKVIVATDSWCKIQGGMMEIDSEDLHLMNNDSIKLYSLDPLYFKINQNENYDLSLIGLAQQIIKTYQVNQIIFNGLKPYGIIANLISNLYNIPVTGCSLADDMTSINDNYLRSYYHDHMKSTELFIGYKHQEQHAKAIGINNYSNNLPIYTDYLDENFNEEVLEIDESKSCVICFCCAHQKTMVHQYKRYLSLIDPSIEVYLMVYGVHRDFFIDILATEDNIKVLPILSPWALQDILCKVKISFYLDNIIKLSPAYALKIISYGGIPIINTQTKELLNKNNINNINCFVYERYEDEINNIILLQEKQLRSEGV